MPVAQRPQLPKSTLGVAPFRMQIEVLLEERQGDVLRERDVISVCYDGDEKRNDPPAK